MQRLVLVLVALSLVMVVPIGQAFGVTSDKLYSCNNLTGDMHEVSRATGQILTTVTPTVTVNATSNLAGLPFTTIDKCLGLASDPTDGQMYMLIRDSNTSRFIATVDPVTDNIFVVGETTVSAGSGHFSPNNIAFDSTGQMFVTQSKVDGSDVFAVDKRTGILNATAECTLDTLVDDFYGGFTLNQDDNGLYFLHKGLPFYDLIKADFNNSGCVGTVTTLSGFTPTNFPQDMTYDTTTSKFVVRDNFVVPQDLITFGTDGVTTNIGTEATIEMKGLAFAVSLPPDITSPIVTGTTTGIVVGGDTAQTFTDEYIESCTATDDNDPANPLCGVKSGGIDTTVLGLQSVTYNATDNAGNEGTQTISTTVLAVTISTNKLYSCDNPNDGGNQIHQLNKTNGSVISSQNITISSMPTYSGCLGLASDPTDGQMYMIAKDSFADRFLTKIDPTTGVGTEAKKFLFANQVSAFNSRTIGFNATGSLFTTESATSGFPVDLFTVNKTSAVVNSNNIFCTFATVGNVPFYTLNYDTGQMNFVNGNSTSLFTGVIDETGAGGACEQTNILTDRTPSNFGQGVAYDTNTGNLYFLDNFNTPHDFVAITQSGVTTQLGTAINAGIEKGLTFSITLSVGITGVPPVLNLNGGTVEADQYNAGSYVELGAGCLDLEDGVITPVSIDISGINFSVIGTYGVIYTCIDSDLNEVTDSRNVNILFAPQHIYTFDGTLADSLGTGNDFVLTDGGAGLNATGWNFAQGDFAQVTGAIPQFDYAFEFVYQFANSTKFSTGNGIQNPPIPLHNEWNQLVEFHNWQTSGAANSFDGDAGIWVSPQDRYYFECVSTCGWFSNADVFDPDTLQHVIVTRNATSEFTYVYLNGLEVMIQNNGVPFPDNDSPEMHFSQDILTLFGTNFNQPNGVSGHNHPEWAGSGYLNCVNIYSEYMNPSEAISRSAFNPVQCSSQNATAPAYPITNLNATNVQEFQADLTWTEPLHEGNLVGYQVQAITPQGIPVTTFETTTNTFTTATDLIFGTDYSFDVHAITDSLDSFGRAGNIADITTLTTSSNTTLTLFDQTTCEALPYNGTFSSHSSFDFCGVTDELFLRGGFIYNVDPNILLSVGTARVQSTSNFNLNGDLTIRDSVLNEGIITNDGTIQVFPIANTTLIALHPAVFSDDDGVQSLLDNDGIIINNGLIDNTDTLDQLSIVDNSNSIVNNGQVISGCLSTYLGTEPTVNARIIEGCFGLIDSFPLDVAWDLSTAVESDLPLPFQIGLYDSSNNLIGSFTGEITVTGAQNAVATFNQPIPADGLVSIGVGGNNIRWLGDDTNADFSSSILPNPFVVDGNTNSSQRTVITVFHPDQNTNDEQNSIERFEQTKNIALTVVGVLPVALFFVLFSILSPRVDGEGE